MMVCSLSSTSSLCQDSLALFWHISRPLTATPPALAACIVEGRRVSASATEVSTFTMQRHCTLWGLQGLALTTSRRSVFADVAPSIPAAADGCARRANSWPAACVTLHK